MSATLQASTPDAPDPIMAHAEGIVRDALDRLHPLRTSKEEYGDVVRDVIDVALMWPTHVRERAMEMLIERGLELGIPAPRWWVQKEEADRRNIGVVDRTPDAPAPRKRTNGSRSRVPSTPIGTSDALLDGIDPHTDLANAHRLVREHGDDLRHCVELGWLTWNGRAWSRDDGEPVRRAADVAQRLLSYAAAQLARAQGKEAQAAAEALLVHARKSQSEPAIRRALELAKHLAPIACSADAFDRDPWLFNCAEGAIDLRKGVLREHRRDDLITRMCPVAYDPNAKAPVWEACLARVLPDADLQGFLQRVFGYTLTGSTGEQILVICYGSGANGKSTVLETVRRLLGDYAAHAQTSTLMHVRERGADNDLVRLRGARFVTAIESGEGRRLDEERIKSLTGGDTITARLLYHEPIEFLPQFKLFVACNHRPEVRGTDHGIWRRLRLVPFDVQIPEAERDPQLGSKLDAEAPGILAWMVRGCLDWQRDGLQPPGAVLAATTEWRSDSDVVAQFIAERCVVMAGVSAMAGALHADFQTWARAQGLEPMTQQAFGRRLTDAGHEQKRSTGGRKRWIGIGLQAEGSDVE